MILTEQPGDILTAGCDTVLCTINVVGAMGKGVAEACKKEVRGLFSYYQSHYSRRPDETNQAQRDWLVKRVTLFRSKPFNVLLFPTKQHWADPSRIEWIDHNLGIVAKYYQEMAIGSLAMPPPGCGNGGLDYERDVKALVHKHLGPLPIPVHVCL